MFYDRDFVVPAQPAPRQASKVVAALEQDLNLPVVLEAMAKGDRYVLEVCRLALLSGLSSPAAIRYRQAVLRDCSQQPRLVMEIYGTATAALRGGRRVWRGDRPLSMLHSSLDVFEHCLPALKRLRALAGGDNAGDFHSEAFSALFRMLRQQLSDEYFSELEGQLSRLRLQHGTLFSAKLGDGNEPAELVLRLPPGKHKRSLLGRVQPGRGTETGFEIDPRNEAGMKSLEDLQAKAIRPLAVTVRRAAEHVIGFFEALRAELAFYIGALNLSARLSAKGEPMCFPTAADSEPLKLSARGLYDPGLSLLQDARVVGNDLRADGSNLIVVTGANQGGKSTFLRGLGLAQLMMQCGMFVAATSYEANVGRGVFTHFKASEDPSMEQGKLDEELARMSELADGLSSNCLVLFNEPFASTNETEGSEIGLQVVRALRERNVKVAIVTHLFSLARALYSDWRERALFLEAERLTNGERTFQLREGRPCATSHANDLYWRVFADDPSRSSSPLCRM